MKDEAVVLWIGGGKKDGNPAGKRLAEPQANRAARQQAVMEEDSREEEDSEREREREREEEEEEEEEEEKKKRTAASAVL
ncbi:hypothetical protein TEQG_08691 [Trichophyton equinum CBS 127.97]|uniref:Uncharacterized protein n=1 Tax=Trichophyton equinum (strain ATCC MYA-4606 / CBS 127.97) TaxID=559882 RepID=F2PTJ7_TRIEC|nr:hypothetical protein TEQG_08691 [Trichophyton equinum CBS 127.97]